ncbi:DUF58 domain-containing protein [Leifsonia sp. ZF2019]|uniref:DUF58 domain-containing protein n=1 Tax=Leifsonia sp. ZF2019 TaxID=2781978 RepID=UPI001CBF0B72|nr:DUF58 domain-containing protein [Leifsonia sp. ZF2019]UAJ77902.1 DUF58 domain-containing protein [Leifsonia sp. ZF2019]
MTDSASRAGAAPDGKSAGSPLRRVPSPAQTGAALVAAVCMTAAFLFGRVELVLVAAPLLLAVLGDRVRRPRDGSAVTMRAHAVAAVDGSEPAPGIAGAGEPARDDGATARVAVAVSAAAAPGSHPDAIQLRITPADRAPVDTVLTPRAATQLRVGVAVGHSGPQRVVLVEGRAIGADASWTGDPDVPGAAATVVRVVRPAALPIRSLPLPARLQGLTGQHVSSRPGDGGEFRDVDRYRAGDRLRRIDWKATARRAQRPGELYVRRTTATSDAAVQLVLDARDDLPGEVADWAAPHPRAGLRSLDVAREAAVSLATAYAAVADRVGFDDIADAARALPPRSGSRHREAVLRRIETTTARRAVGDRVRVPRLATGALVYVLSTFLDDQPLRLALTWRAAGHRVIAVDVLPPLRAATLTAREQVALRVVAAERAVRLERLRAAGADLLVWTSPDRDSALRRLAAPRRRTTAGRPA